MFSKSHCTIALSWLENHTLNSAPGHVDEVDPTNNDIILSMATPYSYITHGLKDLLYNFLEFVGETMFEGCAGSKS